MLHPIRILSVLMVCSLVAAGLPGLAQSWAKAGEFSQTTHYAAQPQALLVHAPKIKRMAQADAISRLTTPELILQEQLESTQPIQLKKRELSLAAADQTVNGRVTDGATGGGLPGVSVVVKGTSRGTTTDTDGNFRVTVPEQNVTNTLTLVFSFIGYATQEIVVGTRNTVNVTMASDDKTLNEIVVVGYGTQNRRELTGSVAPTTQTIKDQPVTNVVEGLTGRMPGVLIQQNTGAPGNAPSIKVRD